MDAEWSGFAMIWRSIWIWNKRNAWNNNEKNLEIWNPQRVWFPSMRYLLSRLPSSTGKWPPTARSSGATRKSNAMLFSHLPGSNGKKHIWHNLDKSNRLKINNKKHILRKNLPITQLGGPGKQDVGWVSLIVVGRSQKTNGPPFDLFSKHFAPKLRACSCS